jgi:hypothetical protein
MTSSTASVHKHASHWQIFLAFGAKARKLFHGVAFHAVVDGHESEITFTAAIPWIFAFRFIAPWPLNRVTAWLSGGIGERAEYGLWHDYYETKWQWRFVLDLAKVGREKRRIHEHDIEHQGVRQIQYLTDHVPGIGNRMTEELGYDRWALTLMTWHVKSERFWIPDLYDYRFILRVEDQEGHVQEATLKAAITPRLHARDVFLALIRQIQRHDCH